MGNYNSVQKNRQHAISQGSTTSRGRRSSLVRMPSKRRKTARVLLEKKVWYVGKWFIRGLTEMALEKLRSQLRLSHGSKTKLRLTTEGLGHGYKTGSVFRKVSGEFIPLGDIFDFFVDEKFLNALICLVKVGDNQFETVCFRCSDDVDAKMFVKVYHELTGRPLKTLVESVLTKKPESANWVLMQKQDPRAKDIVYLPHQKVQYLSGHEWKLGYQNGNSSGQPSLSDAITNKVEDSTEYRQWSEHRDSLENIDTMPNGVSTQVNKDHTPRRLINAKLLSTIDRSQLYSHDDKNLADVSIQVDYDVDEVDRRSRNSKPSSDSMKREINYLSKEVTYLRNLMREPKGKQEIIPENVETVEKSDFAESKDPYGYLAEENDVKSFHSQGSSDSGFANVAAKQWPHTFSVDSPVGAARVMVGDYRDKENNPERIVYSRPETFVDGRMQSSHGHTAKKEILNRKNKDVWDSASKISRASRSYSPKQTRTARPTVLQTDEFGNNTILLRHDNGSSGRRLRSPSSDGHRFVFAHPDKEHMRTMYGSLGPAGGARVVKPAQAASVIGIYEQDKTARRSTSPDRFINSQPSYFLVYTGDKKPRAHSSSRYEAKGTMLW